MTSAVAACDVAKTQNAAKRASPAVACAAARASASAGKAVAREETTSATAVGARYWVSAGARTAIAWAARTLAAVAVAVVAVACVSMVKAGEWIQDEASKTTDVGSKVAVKREQAQVGWRPRFRDVAACRRSHALRQHYPVRPKEGPGNPSRPKTLRAWRCRLQCFGGGAASTDPG